MADGEQERRPEPEPVVGTGHRGEPGPTEPPEVDEADWMESLEEPAGGFVGDLLPPAFGDRLGEAGEADLLESAAERLEVPMPEELPAEAPVADVLEQHRLPSDHDDEERR